MDSKVIHGPIYTKWRTAILKKMAPSVAFWVDRPREGQRIALKEIDIYGAK